jgi:acyl-coenzyme A synthetase/AMP-(fatty) acid ligase
MLLILQVITVHQDGAPNLSLSSDGPSGKGPAMYLNRIYEHARLSPDKLAVISNGEEFTYRRFATSIEAMRNHLSAAGLPENGIVVNITSNLYLDWVLLLALRSLGYTTVSGASWDVIEELNLKGVAALACYSHQTEAMQAFRSAMPECRIVEMSTGIIVGADRQPLPQPVLNGHFGDHILYTSGTTGTYKKLLFTGQKLDIYIETDRFGFTTRYLSQSDVMHGLNFGPWTAVGYKTLLPCWARGATVIFDSRPDWPKHFLTYPVTMATIVPNQLNQLCDNVGPPTPNSPRMRIQVGGGFLDVKLANRLIEALDCEVMTSYAGTEFRTALANFVHDEDDLIWLTPTFEPGIEIVDEHDMPVPIGTEGMIRIKSALSDPTEYIDDPVTSAKHFRGGYFHPGDMAVRREDGRIRILGRVDDVLNIAGHKVAVEPLERVASQILGLEPVCLFNQQDESGNDILIVVVEGDQPPESARLEELGRQIPQVRQMRCYAISHFPRGENGMMKINRRKVIDLIRSY